MSHNDSGAQRIGGWSAKRSEGVFFRKLKFKMFPLSVTGQPRIVINSCGSEQNSGRKMIIDPEFYTNTPPHTHVREIFITRSHWSETPNGNLSPCPSHATQTQTYNQFFDIFIYFRFFIAHSYPVPYTILTLGLHVISYAPHFTVHARCAGNSRFFNPVASP